MAQRCTNVDCKKTAPTCTLVYPKIGEAKGICDDCLNVELHNSEVEYRNGKFMYLNR